MTRRGKGVDLVVTREMERLTEREFAFFPSSSVHSQISTDEQESEVLRRGNFCAHSIEE